MTRNWRAAIVAGTLVFIAVLVGALLLRAGLVSWQGEATSELASALELLTDQRVDAGFLPASIRADDPLLMDRKIILGHDINSASAKDVVNRLFYLDSVDNEQPIDLYISTQGGWTDNAFTIIDAMRMIDAPVNTWAIGGCYSAGALILAAGTGRRIATDNTIIMVHANLADSSEDFSLERLDLARYESLWRNTTDLPEDWYPMTEDLEYYLNAEEALRFGMVDEVFRTSPARSARD